MSKDSKNLVVNADHFLFKNRSRKYIDELINFINNISDKSKNKINKNSLLKNKLYLDNPITEDKKETLTQNIVELIISNHFSDLLDNFEYEPNKKSKSPELIGFIENTQVQVEVKCPNDKQNVKSINNLNIKTLGRNPKNFEYYNDMKEILKNFNLSSCLYNNKDNKVKDYLYESHMKFERKYQDDGVNILIIVLDDIDQMNEYFFYFRFTEGAFFTKNPCLLNPEYFKNVDYVVLSSLGYFHNFYFEVESEIQWNFDKQFNIILENPFRRNSNNLNSLLSFDLSNLFFEYEFEAEDINVANALALRIFYEKKICLKNKISYFPKRSVKNIKYI